MRQAVLMSGIRRPLGTVFTNSVVHAGDALSADVEGAVNPATAKSTYTVTVSTSSDTTPAVSSTYAIVAKHPVSVATVTPSSHTPGRPTSATR